jgi:hypothetical protein
MTTPPEPVSFLHDTITFYFSKNSHPLDMWVRHDQANTPHRAAKRQSQHHNRYQELL